MHAFRTLFAATAGWLIALGACHAEILNIGDAAPPLTVSDWVKGEKFERFEPGKTYVVEFWATWCGPCRASIPHLTELAHEYKDRGVRFVGVAVFEQDSKLVAPFVTEMGEKMDYSVALDSVPEDGKPSDGAMAKGWMDAAEENGIPTAFIVHDGKIAWIGHPMSMDEPLAKITSGQWNLADLVRQHLAEKIKDRKMAAVGGKIMSLYRASDYKSAVAAIDEATDDDPELAGKLAALKCICLCNGGDIEPGLELGAKLLEADKDKPGALNNLAWSVIDPELKNEIDPRVAQFALKAARRAVEITKSEDGYVLDTLAEALFRTGDAAGAVAAEEQALKILAGQSERVSKELNEHLDRYRKAVSKN